MSPRDGRSDERRPPHPPPRLLGGRYLVRRELGRGGMAAILEASDQKTGELVALKLMNESQTNSFDAVLRFEREGAVIAAIEHVNLVRVLDRGRHGRAPYIALELVQGPTLAEYVERVGPLPQQLALTLAWQATQGLAALHQKGVVHRDIKPANLLLEMSGQWPERVKIADFGFIQVGSDRLTDPGKVLGTATYMPPEQALSEPLDLRADLYALGTTLFLALTGRPPFAGEAAEVIAHQILTIAPPPSQLNPSVTAAADRIVACALRKAPANRYPTANALAQDIRRSSPQGVPLAVDPDRYVPSTALGAKALEALRARYF